MKQMMKPALVLISKKFEQSIRRTVEHDGIHHRQISGSIIMFYIANTNLDI